MLKALFCWRDSTVRGLSLSIVLSSSRNRAARPFSLGLPYLPDRREDPFCFPGPLHCSEVERVAVNGPPSAATEHRSQSRGLEIAKFWQKHGYQPDGNSPPSSVRRIGGHSHSRPGAIPDCTGSSPCIAGDRLDRHQPRRQSRVRRRPRQSPLHHAHTPAHPHGVGRGRQV